MRTIRVGILLVGAAVINHSAGAQAPHVRSDRLPDMRSENVAAIAVAPGARLVATGERAALVKLWDARTSTVSRSLKAHDAQVSALAFSPDGKWLASGSFDQSIHLWDVSSGRVKVTLSDHPGHVKSLAFSRDGRLLASTGADGVRVWDLESGSLRSNWPSPRGVVAAVFSPDRTMLASAGGDGVTLRDVESGKVLRKLSSGTSELILTLAFSADARRLAGGGTGRTAKLWDVRSGTLLRTSKGGADLVRSVAFSDDGTTVVVADRTSVRLWNTGTGAMQPVIEDQRFSAVSLSSDGRAMAAAVGDAKVEVRAVR
ncbi:MAG TPA: WD40 repeat domain-containing protein [Thermoanaerobaculia bacterium]|nr:WD40 repeat domain-containing protein [Thermoanaerobaculia bacterium]